MRSTVLFEEHRALGASFTDFGGWNMPIRYENELAEHHAVRNSAAVFDISHMGEIWVRGEAAALDYALTAHISKLAVGRAKYSLILNERGGIIDDLIVYRLAEHEFLIIANASNYPAVAAALTERMGAFDAEVSDQSDDWALLAVQGPDTEKLLGSLTSTDLTELRYYSIAEGELAGVPVHFARTGYTGEDGFELLVRSELAVELWQALLALEGLIPAGLAARDTLRLEAGMPLYGNELSLDTTPLDVGLARACAFDKEFVGREALFAAPSKKLIGLRNDGRRAARHGYRVLSAGREVGEVTSGALSPTLGFAIAMALVDADTAGAITVDIRGTELDFEITGLPFYKRG
jgi:aminomethyltransferase